MSARDHLAITPRELNADGKPRRVGVELEFAAVTPDRVANRIQGLYGGTIEREDNFRYHIHGTCFGEFTAELDTQYAHRSPHDYDNAGNGLAGWVAGFRQAMRELYGDLGSLVIPYEVVCPPIEISEMARLEDLLDALRQEGARGTKENLFYAFGAQLNPDIATRDPEWILAVLKSQILLSSWLRAVMQLDTARQLFAFADPFPVTYSEQILKSDYWPDLETVMTDYLVANPTRNRELDMLPMFAWFDEALVHRYVQDTLIKKRPTFHYRLPDANIGQPDWSLTLEWNRWVIIEKLAENPERLSEMGEAYIENANSMFPSNWAMMCTEWLLDVR
ncbi:MAG: amidoligase family protein [Pseudomonadota bacterium]